MIFKVKKLTMRFPEYPRQDVWLIEGREMTLAQFFERYDLDICEGEMRRRFPQALKQLDADGFGTVDLTRKYSPPGGSRRKPSALVALRNWARRSAKTLKKEHAA